MGFFRIQKSCGFDVRGYFHEVIILLQHRNQRCASATEDFCRIGFFLSAGRSLLIAFCQLRELFVDGQQISRFILQGNAEPGHRICCRIAFLAGCLDLLVQSSKKRCNGMDIGTSQAEHPTELRSFCR